MGFLSWLTGRDKKESDVYANFDKVESVVSNIKNIGTNEVASARDAVVQAINDLNNVKGLNQYVGSVDSGAFSSVFDSIADSIANIGDLIQNKANDIKTYEESAWYEKLGSTFAMAGAKFGEGLLSVGEDLGDGVVSLVGWAAGGLGNKGLQEGCANFVKKEWSHDAFNFYYKSDFAKKSTFTEDSAIAGGLKIAGSTVGYLYLGGAVSGFGGQMKGANMFTKGAKGFLSSTTKINTATAALSGMGTGTESGLRQGKDFNSAAWGGVGQAVIQGGIAYGAGKLGERNARKQAIKDADDALKNAEAKGTELKKQISDAQTNKTKAQQQFETAEKGYKDAQKGLIDAKNKAEFAKKHVNNMKTDNKTLKTKAEAAYKDLEGKAKIAENELKNAKAGLAEAKKGLSAADEALNKVSLKDAQANLDKAAKNLENLRKSDSGATQGMIDRAQNTFESALETKAEASRFAGKVSGAKADVDTANKALNAVKNTKLSDYQGYNDAITKAGQRSGKALYNTGSSIGEVHKAKVALKESEKVYQKAQTQAEFAKKHVNNMKTDNQILKSKAEAAYKDIEGKATKATEVLNTNKSTLSAAQDTLKQNAKELLKENPMGQTVTSGWNGVKNAAGNTVNAFKHPVQTTKAAWNGAGNVAKSVGEKVIHPIQTGKGVVNVINTSTVVPGVIGAAVNAKGRDLVSNAGAAAQFRHDNVKINAEPLENAENLKDQSTVDYSINEKPTSGNGSSDNQSGNQNGGNGGYTGGEYTDGGYTGGGQASVQFRQEPTQNNPGSDNTNPSPVEPTPETPGDTTPKVPDNKPTPTPPDNGPSNNTPTPPNGSGNNNPTPPSNGGGNNPSYTPDNPSGPSHTGGGYTGTGGYTGYTGGGNNGVYSSTDTTPDVSTSVDDLLNSDSAANSIDDIVKGNKYSKIPTGSKPISVTPIAPSSGSGASAAIPIVAGLSAAAAAGVGAKVYMDRKNNNDNGEGDTIETEDWNDEDTVTIDYDDSSDTNEQYLDDDDEYVYPVEEQVERYDARNNEELADLQ